MKFKLALLFILITNFLFAQSTDPKDTEVWEPVPRIVKVDAKKPPSDAIILFDGTDLSAWASTKTSGAPAEWTLIAGNAMQVKAGTGDIVTREKFGSVQLHLEFRTPEVVEGEGQERGNSGVFFQNRYEVQILDSYENKTYPNGQATAIYKQHIPLVNASRGPGQWQTYDIIFQAPSFNKDGIKVASGYFTVIHNGVLVQNHVEIYGTTEYIGMPKNIAHGKDVIKLQDHGNPMQFRNIWLRKLD